MIPLKQRRETLYVLKVGVGGMREEPQHIFVVAYVTISLFLLLLYFLVASPIIRSI